MVPAAFTTAPNGAMPVSSGRWTFPDSGERHDRDGCFRGDPGSADYVVPEVLRHRNRRALGDANQPRLTILNARDEHAVRLGIVADSLHPARGHLGS